MDNYNSEINTLQNYDTTLSIAELLSLQLQRDSRRYSSETEYVGEG